MTLVTIVLVSLATAADAQAPSSPQNAGHGRTPATADTKGVTIGERVQMLTGFGWIDTTKSYPAEARRL